MRGKLPIVLSVTALLVAVFGSAGPAIAHGVHHALFAHNADKVDGKHAVAASATPAQRAGKLVAANAAGRHPDSDLLDGLDSTALQRRVSEACLAGSSVRAVNADGTVLCETDDGEAYTAGEGLSLSGTAFALSTAGCEDGDVWKRSSGAWSCDPDVDTDTDTTYSAGDGLTLSGTQFALSSSGCAAGELWKWSGTAWGCVPDDDTTYAAGDALALADGQFGLATTGCQDGDVWKRSSGAWSCDPDAGTSYSAGEGIGISGTTIALASTGCSSGEGWEWTGSAWACDPDDDALSALACSDGDPAEYSTASGWVCGSDDDHVGDGTTIETNGDGTLTVGTISSAEIADEPAVKASSSGSGNVTSSASAKASVTVTAPGAGYLMIVCQATFNAPSLTAPASISAQLKEGAGSLETWTWDPGDADSSLDLEQTHTSLVTLSGPGEHTYELWLSAASGTTPFDRARVFVQYFPTSL